MKITTIAVSEEDKEKAKYLAKINNLKMYEFFHFMITFFEENKEFIDIKNQKKIEDLFENKINKIITKNINRIIGFIKKQDEIINNIQEDVRSSTKQILYKMIPLEEQQYTEYHPFFNDYDRILSTLITLLEKQGLQEGDIEKEIEKHFGENFLKKYKESQERIRYKSFL